MLAPPVNDGAVQLSGIFEGVTVPTVSDVGAPGVVVTMWNTSERA